MSSPFLGEIRIVGFNFPPKGWALCDGQLLPISQNTALFSLLGTFYGGNGTTNFALPNLQGASPRGVGQGPGLSYVTLGETGGSASVTLAAGQMPSHTHTAQAAGETGTLDSPSSAAWAEPAHPAYAPASGLTAMSPGALNSTGQGLPHNNLPPYLVLNFVIALQGIFPPHP